MTRFQLAVVPVGKVDREEVEAAAGRAAKILRQPVELRESLPVPRHSEDPERGQHRVASLIDLLRKEVVQLATGNLVGNDDPQARASAMPNGYLFITDVDLFTAKTDGVFAALISRKQTALISVKRLREAFYRRKADPTRQRTRLFKEILRMAGRLQGLSECPQPDCVMAASKSVPDLDTKAENYCRACSQRMFEGKVQI